MARGLITYVGEHARKEADSLREDILQREAKIQADWLTVERLEALAAIAEPALPKPVVAMGEEGT